MEIKKIKSEKERQRNRLLALLGDWPERQHEVEARTINVDNRGVYVLETLELELNGLGRFPLISRNPLIQMAHFQSFCSTIPMAEFMILGKVRNLSVKTARVICNHPPMPNSSPD